MGEERDFIQKFGRLIDHSKSQSTDDKPTLEGRGQVT